MSNPQDVLLARTISHMTTPRRFLLSDAIVLVSATAVGLAVVKPYYAAMTPLRWTPPFPFATRFIGWIEGVWVCLILASPFAAAWTLAVLGLALRRPRARWSRLVRQPGLVAGLMAAFVLVVRLPGFATMCVRVVGNSNLAVRNVTSIGGGGIGRGGGCFTGLPPGYLWFDADHFLNTMAMIGVAVGSSWILLLLSGRWRAERSWNDRVGRVLGWFWIAILPFTCWWDFHVRF
jgi:hypothetical protein